jgi:hypothetical protein
MTKIIGYSDTYEARNGFGTAFASIMAPASAVVRNGNFSAQFSGDINA